ncbi:MAG: pilus assembly protein CpaD [Novosphingobium sp.]|nr:pilus assembly protein CpaD [Novosphingobium sp.]
MRIMNSRKTLASALSLGLVVALGGCGGGGFSGNGTLESVRQPVVTTTSFTLDVAAGPGGVSIPEQRRLSGWFDAMALRYGDRIYIDDPMKSAGTRSAIEGVAGRYGMLVGDDAPLTQGEVAPGVVRVIIARSSATVPDCPNWSQNSDANLTNGTNASYGCAVNSNMAAMVADPQHLIQGATGTGVTTVMSSIKAIESYREAPPTGEGNLKKQSTLTGK